TGITYSSNFPTTLGAVKTFGDGFVAKLNANGTALLYSTYIGGSGSNVGSGITVDASGNAYVTGGTSSLDFPTTPGALQGVLSGSYDAFVVELVSQATQTIVTSSGNGSVYGQFVTFTATVTSRGSTVST